MSTKHTPSRVHPISRRGVGNKSTSYKDEGPTKKRGISTLSWIRKKRKSSEPQDMEEQISGEEEKVCV